MEREKNTLDISLIKTSVNSRNSISIALEADVNRKCQAKQTKQYNSNPERR